MYHLAAPNVDPYMVAIAYQIPRLCLSGRYSYTYAALGRCDSGKRYTKLGKYRLSESGAIRTVGQAGSTGHIRVTHELTSETCNCCSVP